MFFFKLLIVYKLFCLCTQSRILTSGLKLKKTTKPHQTVTIVDEVKARDLKEDKVPDERRRAQNATRRDKVNDLSGSRRQFAEFAPHIDAYPHQTIPIQGPFHHVHLLPKPYPVVSVRYVPRPLPIPYAVPSHVHVSHLHLRPKCK